MSRIHLATLLIASAAGAVGGAVTAALLSDRRVEGSVAAIGDDGRVARLEQANAELARRIDELRSGQALLASRGERAAASVDGSAAAAPAGTAPIATDPTANVAASADAAPTVESLLAQLLDPETDHAESVALWEKANKAGLLDGIVAAMEERAAREPNNPDLKVDLGDAYLQEVFAASAMGKGKWAMKADAAFDAALEIDPQHWQARFTKAVALSNWPAFLGKQGASIAEFETLISQQNAVEKKPEHAQTYFFLGNLYLNTGSKEKAIATWQQGLALFPENAQLQQQIAQNH